MDLALNELLLTRNFSGADLIFTEEWLKHKENYVIDFYKSDSDVSLLTLPQAEEIDAMKNKKKQEHLLCWYTLYQKGRAMLQSYERDILPRIIKVIAVQGEIALVGQSEDGSESEDTITGIIDLEAEVRLDDGEIVEAIIDNKTSSQPYTKNCVETKEQTALYNVAKPEYQYAAFAVVQKKPPFKTQFLIGKPPEALKEKTMQQFVDVLEKIKAGHFPQNKKSCWSFGSKCCYYSYCHGGDFDANIVTAKASDR